MDKTTLENLKQFRNFSQLLSYTQNKYVKDIDKFIKKDNNNIIIGCKVPIIADILPNKEIVFSDELSFEFIPIEGLVTISNIQVACIKSLATFLEYPYDKCEKEINLWFKEIIEKN